MRKMRNRQRPGDLQQVRQVMGEGIEMLEQYILAPHERGDEIPVKELTSLMHALSQAANTYARLVEVGEFDERLAVLEAA